MPIKQSKGAKGKADRLFSKLIRERTPTCEKCGTTDGLTCSHIIGRRYSATRCDMDNAQTLCFSCHRRFTDFPKEFADWLDKTIGAEEYERLRLKAETYRGKMNWDDEYNRLRKLEN